MPGPPLPPAIPDRPGDMPRALDAMSVGRSIFGECSVMETPVVDGFSKITFLARGGFSNVWRARRDSDGTPVALKIPHQADPETAERLEGEAETLQSLNHPHIVRLLDVTTAADGAPVLVMELIEGSSLTERLPDAGFDFDHALQILLPVLDAVAHAHSRGIVHRDLKPSNILTASDGTPKVSDFGLAQSLKDQRVAFSLTRTGVLAGTVEYLAPERYEPGSESSIAADIFALGIILYELLTGRPPRGAWSPLSQLKRLDVRLDELLAEAIHPDPAKRLPSAEHFAKSLTEIRDSRPRYSGTPLVTRAVRITDALWTAAGLYFLAAGFCSLLSMNNTNVPGFFNLTFHHTKLLGGYWALWVLCIGMGLVWTWQAIRLWRFRNIPLREALPAPFGLPLGHSRGGAVLVSLAQLFCAWAPLAYMVWIYSQSWIWITPDTPVWERGLAITRWGSETPVSQWTWDPAGMFSGDEFWIRDTQPWLAPGTWQQHDRQSYFVVTQPLLMVLGMTGITAGILTTCVACVMAWCRRHWFRLGLLFACLISAGTSLNASLQEELKARERVFTDDQKAWGARLMRERDLMPAMQEIFDALFRHHGELAPLAAEAFAPTVDTITGGILERSVFLRQLEGERHRAEVQRQRVEGVRLVSAAPASVEHNPFQFNFEAYTDPPAAHSTGSCHSLLWRGTLPAGPLKNFISVWWHETTALYKAELRILETQEAESWLHSFIGCLNMESCPDLESFLLPTMLIADSTGPGHSHPTLRATIAATLRASRAASPTAGLASASLPSLRRLPGARWELTCRLLQTGTRSDGQRVRSEPLLWQIEIVFVDGRWQVLRLRM